jgi:catechol 2,3-dioxygenase-like lactoylglutathione lyase family enzyme
MANDLEVGIKTEPNVQQLVPLFGVRDIQESLRFYIDGLGFSMTNNWSPEGRLRWCWLELGGVAIMLQEFWGEGHRRTVPDGKVGVGIGINFICKDALAMYREMRSRGIEVKRPFVGNAMWVAEVADPDGYCLYFESPTDVAEETVFSE